MSEVAVSALVTLLDRVRARSRSRWPALVDAHPDDEAHGHAAFAELEASAPALELREEPDDEALIESSPRIKLAARASLAPPPEAPEPAAEERDEAPVLEVVAERALGDVAEDEVAEAMPLLDHVSLGELLEASLGLRPRPDAW